MDESEKNVLNNQQDTIARLCSHAGNIIAMLKHVLNAENGTNYGTLLMYVSGLAGHACQRAIVANGEGYEKVSVQDGRNYYFGDEVNAYLFENRYSIISFMNAIYNKKTGENNPDVSLIIKNCASVIGKDNYKIWNIYEPNIIYKMIKSCWDGIFNNMTSKYCTSPMEWPILFGIILQNVMNEGMTSGKEKYIYDMALECVLFISKMRDDSII